MDEALPGSYVNTINKCALTRHNCQILQRLSSCFIAVCLVFGHQIKQFPFEHKKLAFPSSLIHVTMDKFYSFDFSRFSVLFFCIVAEKSFSSCFRQLLDLRFSQMQNACGWELMIIKWFVGRWKISRSIYIQVVFCIRVVWCCRELGGGFMCGNGK